MQTNRLAGTVVMVLLIVIALFDSVRTAVPYWEVVLAVGLILTWMLGRRYERELIVEAGLADLEEIRRVEREGSRWWS